MAFHDVRFPVDISYGSTGGPNYSTDVITTYGGYEQRNINWAQARARYNVAHGVKTQAQLDALIAFFRARKGRAHAFRFKDWTDFEAAAAPLGTGDGTATAFPLLKQYASGGVAENRLITKPVTGTVQVYVGGVLQTAGYTVDHTSGMVTFDAPPANEAEVTADFAFDVPVRFDTDQLSARLENYGVRSWLDIPLVEVRT